MEKSMPRSSKEGLLYGAIICGLTCICMATINISIGMGGISTESLLTALKAFPIVFIIAMIVENFIVGKVASKLVYSFIPPKDSLNAHILYRTFFTVVGMSIIMTIIGGMLSGGINIEILKEFPISWPRNFCIAIFLELIIVQPIARAVMRLLHEKQEKKQNENIINS